MNEKTTRHRGRLIAPLIISALVIVLLLAIPGRDQASSAQAAVPAEAESAPQAAIVLPETTDACLPDGSFDSTYEQPRFCVYYNTSLSTLADATLVANLVNQYWNRYVALGFTAPLVSGGESKLRVKIVGGSCNGTAWENYIEVRQNCIDVSDERIQKTQGHELFHRVQFGYYTDWYTSWTDIAWVFEGTARMMEDEAETNIDHWPAALSISSSFNTEVNNYLASTRYDLTSYDMRYESALWWKYFAEKYGLTMTEPQRGVDAIRMIWERVDTASDIAAINSTLAVLDPGMTFDKAFRRFTVANWTKDLTGLPDSSYYYEDEREVGNPAPYGPIIPADGGTINITTTASWTNQSVARYGARYYKATIGASCPVITASFHRDSGPDAFYHIVTQKGSAFATHKEGSGADWTQSFLNDGITQVAAIIGGQNNAAQVDVTLSCANPTLNIVIPNSTAVAYAGKHNKPAKFLAQVQVTNGAGGPVVTGLVNDNFTAQVNGADAPVTGGGFVQEQYWLVLQAPSQLTDGTYDLSVSLQVGGIVVGSATNPGSVAYTNDYNDQLLVIDRSGSMGEADKMAAAKEAADLYVAITRDKDGLGVIGFDDVLHPPAPFTLRAVDDTVRADANNFIATLFPDGMTSIGVGLQEAINERKSTPTDNPRCSIVLLSDGMENTPPYYSTIKPELQALGCPVTTIALGPAADETLLQQIAADNGGLYFYNDVFTSSPVSPASVDTVADTHLDLANIYEYSEAFSERRMRLLSEKGLVAYWDPQTHKFDVDESVDEIVFTLDWLPLTVEGMTLELWNPDGKQVPEADWAQVFKDSASRQYGGRLLLPMPGTWSLVVKAQVSKDPVPYQVIVSGASSLTVELLLPDRYGRRFTTGERIPIYAFLSSKAPIAGAQVKARITAPNGVETLLTLFDDGNHDDGAANDGLYANFYTRVTQSAAVPPTGEEKNPPPKDEGSYRVLVTADGTAGKFRFHREAIGAFSVLAGADDDQDGIPDAWEKENQVTSPRLDNDMDGLLNGEEYLAGTDPNDPDTDNGGESDGSEVHRQIPKDPLNPVDDGIKRPPFLKALAQPGMVRLLFDPHSGQQACDQVRLFRSDTGPNGPYSLIATLLDSNGVYSDKAPNGFTYFYRMICDLNDGTSSGYVESAGATPSDDPYPPEASMIINNGALMTGSPQVHLTFEPLADPDMGEPDTFSDIKDVMLSNSPDFPGAAWQTFGQDLDWTLETLPAGSLAHVYARFRDSANNESVGVVVATIRIEITVFLPAIRR